MDYLGYKTLQLTDEQFGSLYTDGVLGAGAPTFVQNEYLIATDRDNNPVDYFCWDGDRFRQVRFNTISTFDNTEIKPRNPEQRLAFDLMKNRSVPVKLLTGQWGSGKAQPLSTIIPTPDGNKELRDIRPGDYVFDRKGKPTKVLGVYPQGKIDNYRVVFNDGRVAYCNNEHIWSCYTSKKNLKNFTVQEMLDKGLRLKDGNYRFRIPLNKSVDYPKKQLEIDPYVIGTFLGNGCCLEEKLTISSADEELVQEIAKLINAKSYERNHENNYSWAFTYKDEDKRIYTMNPALESRFIRTKAFFRKYPEMLSYALDKKIPDDYLYSSKEQRLALLQGLLDTDGTIDKEKGRIRFSTTSFQLKEDVKMLVWSLGFLCSESVDSRIGGHHKNICYGLQISTPVEEKPKLFRLSRKRKIAEKNIEKRQKSCGHTLTIRNIEKMSEPVEMACIYVDNDEHLYLTENYVVTHNTLALVAQAYEDLSAGRFEKIVWIRNNVQVKDTDNIGYLPGDSDEKLLPYVMPFADHCGGVDCVLNMINQGLLEVIPLGFLRGRSIRNAVVISSEAENLTKQHIQLLLGRIDEGSQLWFDADIRQRDRDVFVKSAGIETMVERLAGNPLFGYVHLNKSERSPTAQLADLLND